MYMPLEKCKHTVCVVWYANNEIYITHTVRITLLWEKV